MSTVSVQPVDDHLAAPHFDDKNYHRQRRFSSTLPQLQASNTTTTIDSLEDSALGASDVTTLSQRGDDSFASRRQITRADSGGGQSDSIASSHVTTTLAAAAAYVSLSSRNSTNNLDLINIARYSNNNTRMSPQPVQNNNNNNASSPYRQHHRHHRATDSSGSPKRFSLSAVSSAIADPNKISSHASPPRHSSSSIKQQNCTVSLNGNEFDARESSGQQYQPHIPFTGYVPQPQEVVLRGVENANVEAKAYNDFILNTGQVCGAFCRLMKAREKSHVQLTEYQRSCEALERELKHRSDELATLMRQHEALGDEARQNRDKLQALVRKFKDEDKQHTEEKAQMKREIDNLEREYNAIKWNKQLEATQMEKLKDEVTQKSQEMAQQQAQNEKQLTELREQMRQKQQTWQEELRKLKHEQSQQEQKYQVELDNITNELQNARHEMQLTRDEHVDQNQQLLDLRKQWSDLNASFVVAQRQCDEKDRQLQHLTKEYNQCKRNLEAMAIDYDDCKQRRLADLNQIQQEMSQRDKDYSATIKKLQDERSVLKDDVNKNNNAHEHLQKSYETLQRQHSELQQQHQNMIKSFNALEHNFIDTQNNLDNLRRAAGETQVEYNRSSTTLRDELESKTTELHTTKQNFLQKFQELQAALQERDADNERLRKNIKHYKGKSEVAQRERYASEAHVNAMQEQQDDMTKALNENNITIAKLRADVEDYERRAEQTNNDASTCRKENTALKHSERELKDKLERYQAMYDNLETETRSMELNAQRLKSENELLKRRLERRMQQSFTPSSQPPPPAAPVSCAYSVDANSKSPHLLHSTRSALQLVGGAGDSNESTNAMLRRTMCPTITEDDKRLGSGAGLISSVNAIPKRFDFNSTAAPPPSRQPPFNANAVQTRSDNRRRLFSPNNGHVAHSTNAGTLLTTPPNGVSLFRNRISDLSNTNADGRIQQPSSSSNNKTLTTTTTTTTGCFYRNSLANKLANDIQQLVSNGGVVDDDVHENDTRRRRSPKRINTNELESKWGSTTRLLNANEMSR